MHAPPPLRVSVGHDRAARLALAGIAAAAAGNLTAWGAAWGQAPAGFIAFAACAAILAGAVAGWMAAAKGQQTCELSWDGQSWSCQRAGEATITGSVTVSLDFDAWLLLRFTPHPGRSPRWLALSRSEHRTSWALLRGALYCSRPAAAPSAPPPA